MRKVILYVAISLDGKIAKTDGSVEWLEDLPNPENSDHDYVEFYESIDVTIMGNSTYQQVKESSNKLPLHIKMPSIKVAIIIPSNTPPTTIFKVKKGSEIEKGI